MQPLPVPTGAPLAEIPVDTGPLRIRMREHAPCDAPIDNIKQDRDHRPHIELAVASTWLGWWDHIGDEIPCASVRSVGYGLACIPPVYRTDAAYGSNAPAGPPLDDCSNSL